MKRKIFLIGIVMIIIGIALVAGGIAYFEDSFSSHSSTSFTEYKATGLNYSKNMSLKAGTLLMIEDSASHSALIKSSNISSVKNDSDLSTFTAQSPTDTDDSIEIYIIASTGTYSYVYFNGTTVPHYSEISGSQYDTTAALVTPGILIGIIGLIIMIYGLVKKDKPKNPYASDDPYNIDNIKI